MKFLSTVLLVGILGITAFGQQANTMTLGEPQEDPANSTLRARVYFEDSGRPVRRASVMIASSGRGGPNSARSGLTDDQGNLVITNVKAGKYYAFVNLPGIVTPLAYMNLNERAEDLTEAERHFNPIVIDGMTDAFADIGARRGGIIGGRVVYSDGDPASGVKVEVLRKTDDGYTISLSNMSAIFAMMGMGGAFQTDDRGFFRFAGLPAGEYIVKVSQNANHTKSRRSNEIDEALGLVMMRPTMINTYFDNVHTSDEARVLEVGFGQEISDVNIILPERGYYRIAGRVVASKDKLPITQAIVRFERVGESENAFTKLMERQLGGSETDAEGKFEIVDLPKGKYRVTIEPQYSHFDPAKRTYGPDPDRPDAMMEAAAAAMRAAAAAAGAPPPPPPPRPRGGGTAAVRGGSQPKPQPPAFAARSIEFEIDDQDKADETIELTFGSTLSGTVETADRKDLPSSLSISVNATDSDLKSSTSVSNFNFDYDEEGNSRPKPPTLQKDFKIEGISAGSKRFVVTVSDTEYYVKSATAGGRDLTVGSFDFAEGGAMQNVKIVLANDTGKLKRKVITDDREPARGVKLRFVPTDASRMFNASFVRIAVTDDEGEFEVDLPPMEYAILFAGNKKETPSAESEALLVETIKDAKKVKVDAKGTATVTLTYVKPGK